MRKSLVKRPELSAIKSVTADHFHAVRRISPVGGMPCKLMSQLLGLTVGLTLSAWASAVGLGAINVVSALGQPLKAEIGLLAVGNAEKPSLVARLAAPETYRGAGLDYPHGIQYSFQIDNRANGEPYLKISSNHEVNDPFVSLLVELSWSSGKLMREYTFLLDPPGYVANQPKPAAVQTVSPVTVQSVPLMQAPEAHQVAPVAAPAPVERVKRVAVAQPEASSVATGSITVRRGDTLNGIAERIKPDEISLERMLVALYRANETQFDRQNMNRIRTGKILRVPDQAELANVTQSEAVQEIRAQASDWNAYRQKLAAAASSVRQKETAGQVASGKISSVAADKTPVASESAREVLRLSKGDAPGDKAGKSGLAQDKRNFAAEEAIAKEKTLKEGKDRAALLEQNIKDMKHLAELKSEAAGLQATSGVSVTAPVASAVAATSNVVAANAVMPASHVVAASAPAATEEMSIIDQFMATPLYMGIGAALLLALGGLGIGLSRRKNTPEQLAMPESEGGSSKTGQLTSPVVPSPDTGDFTVSANPDEELTAPVEDVDPISEAELFLNFGRDEQAEEVLKDALLHSPNNHQVHLKLLGIYARHQDAKSFAEVYELLKTTGDEQAIGQADELAKSLQAVDVHDDVHDDVLAGVEDSDSATQFVNALDMGMIGALPETAVSEVQPVASADEAQAIDFDVTSVADTQPAILDFDVTSTSPLMTLPEELDFDIASLGVTQDETEQPAEVLPSLDDLIFDISAAPDTIDMPASETAAKVDEDDGMAFTLDFPLDDLAPAPAHLPQPAIVNLADINLNLDDVESVPSALSEQSEHWHEVATKIDLAKAYQDMGDAVGAREILDEVLQEGDETQKQEAELLIKQLG